MNINLNPRTNPNYEVTFDRQMRRVLRKELKNAMQNKDKFAILKIATKLETYKHGIC